MVVNIYIQGLMITVVGITLTFLALGLLILAMNLLQRFFRDSEPAEPVVEAAAVPDTQEAEIAAAIATALAYWRSKSQSGLGATLPVGPSPWWAAGRAMQNPANALQKTKGRN
jgi:sodium pump decarboxylase gamma subunit